MKASVLADNIASGTLDGEWGLSIYIEYGETNILLDTGASDLFLRNAEKLGKSIPAVDYAVLSHAHYDHADGMQTFFANNEKASFYLRSGSDETCYDKRWIFRKYIGLPKGILNDYKTRIVFAQGDTALCPGVPDRLRLPWIPLKAYPDPAGDDRKCPHSPVQVSLSSDRSWQSGICGSPSCRRVPSTSGSLL